MKGEFRYKDKDGKFCVVDESDRIPSDATELTAWLPDFPPPPHSLEDHQQLDAMLDEFNRIYVMIYGALPEDR